MGAGFCSIYHEIHYIEVCYIKDLTCPILIVIHSTKFLHGTPGFRVPVPLLSKYLLSSSQYRESTADQVDDQSTFHWVLLVHRHIPSSTIDIYCTYYRTDTIQCFHKHRIVCKETLLNLHTPFTHKKKTEHNINSRARAPPMF